jgi:hypothetical protein
MVERVSRPEPATGETDRRDPAQYLLSFTIGAFVGAGIAAIWFPERRRRRLPAVMGRRYRRVRDASAAVYGEIREAGREIAGEFREDLAAGLEAAREEFKDMARLQLKNVRGSLRREHGKVSD